MSSFVFGQSTDFVERIDPPNWFSGMNNSEVELLFYSNDKEELTISLHSESKKYVSLVSVEKSKLNNYYYVGLSVKSQPKDNHIFFIVDKAGSSASLMIPYSITPKSANPLGLSQADAMYMVFPDRFANADATNDSVANYFQGANHIYLIVFITELHCTLLSSEYGYHITFFRDMLSNFRCSHFIIFTFLGHF